ncbi:MAG: hypothetical protein OEQ13_09865 [Acidobacteriota bacterium]|nr:hypothetical protein [Acidobacteriota bacterium]
MSDALEPRPISREGIPEAVQKAEHYRLLNQPEQAESICRDVLRVDPGHQQALVEIILAMSDQLAMSGHSPDLKKIREYIAKLHDEYQKLYYTGIAHERAARALLGRRQARAFAYEEFREAMQWYEKAEKIRPVGHDDPILRWNSCVRAIKRAKLRPRPVPGETQLE